MLGGGHRTFPDRALVQLAVAGDDEDARVALLDLRGNRHADANRQAVAKSAGGRLDPRHFAALRVTAENRVRAAILREVRGGEEAFVGKNREQTEAAVAL